MSDPLPIAGEAAASAPISPTEALAWFALLLAGGAGAALCAGAEMGVYSVNRVRLRVRSKRGEGLLRTSASILHDELEHTPRVLATLLIGYNLFSYLNSVGTTALLSARGYSEATIIALNVLVIGPVLFVLMDSLPKDLFRAEPDRLLYAMARPLRWMRWGMTATLILPMTQAAARGLSALVGGAGEEAIGSARERIASLLKEGAQHAMMSESQLLMLDRAFALRRATVGDEMVPWDQAVKIQTDWDRARVLELAASRGFSRYPVVDAQGNPRGVLNILDLLLQPQRPLADLIKPAMELDEDLPVRDALVGLATNGSGMALVVSAGSRRGRAKPFGIVTAKDLVEPLTGELKSF